jgi:serine/threonine protein kinase
MDLFDGLGKPLGPSMFVDRGGEGEIRRLHQSPHQVAKVYFQRSSEKRRKLEVMIAAPPADPARPQGHSSIAWPDELVFDTTGDFVGFLMPWIDTGRSRKLIDIYSPTDYPKGLTWADLLLVARNVAVALSALHARGYVIGDLNEANILVADNGFITFVDCDSIQVPDPASGKVFRCPVGRGEYTAPELQGVPFDSVDRSPETDAFALAVVIGQLLLLGRHPFSGGPNRKIEDNIRSGASFLFTLGAQSPTGTPPPSILPPRVLALLIRCFRDGHSNPAARPSTTEWGDALDDARRNLRTCPIRQIHRYHGHLAECPWCGNERQHGFDPFTYKHGSPPSLPIQQTFGSVPLPSQAIRGTWSRSAKAMAAGLAVVVVLATGSLALRRSGSAAPPPPIQESLAPPSPLPATAMAALTSPQDLLGFYSGLQEKPGGADTLVTLHIKSVGEETGGKVPFSYTRNTLTERQDGTGSIRLDEGLITLSSSESYRASTDAAGRLILEGSGARLRRTDQR